MTNFFSKDNLLKFLEEIFPQVNEKIEILKLEREIALVKLRVSNDDLRPGGTISGPSMFLLADVSFYIAILNLIGKQPLAVTTNCSINFIRKPKPNDLVAEARILKRGQSLIYGDVMLKSEDENTKVAHAVFTYSVPK
mgnify:CR=1 FL=1